MDRNMVYVGEQPQTVDILACNKDNLVGLAYAMRGLVGTNVEVNGLAVTPTSPIADLRIHIDTGSIYALDTLDATAYGDLGADTSTVVKQGLSQTPLTFTITPPGTAGQSQVFLVEAQLQDNDDNAAVLKYYNGTSVPWNGPSGLGASQNTRRNVLCTVQLKAGVAATTGSQVTPAPDSGYTGLAAVTVANGQTQITGANIVQLTTAPYFPNLPAIPGDMQTSAWTYTTDTGAVNAMAATVYPPVTSLVAGLLVYVKAGHANTGATTFSLNGLTAAAVHRATGAALASGDISLGEIVGLCYDGAAWQIVDFVGPLTTVLTNNYTTFSLPYATDFGIVNAMAASYPNTIPGPTSPGPLTLAAGRTLLIKAANTNTGPTTFNPNMLGAVPVLENGNPLLPAAIIAGEILCLVYDGANFQKMPKRNTVFNADVSMLPSLLPMAIGDISVVTFTNQQSVPLNVATVEGGVYEVELIIVASTSTNNFFFLFPNDTSYPSSYFPSWFLASSDQGGSANSPPFLAAVPIATANQFVTGTFGMDSFFGPNQYDNINDIGPLLFNMTISTSKTAKFIRWFLGITGGISAGYTKWADTTTPWTSLGTFKTSQAGLSYTAAMATLSGVAIIRRSA